MTRGTQGGRAHFTECGCSHCRAELDRRFYRIICATWDEGEVNHWRALSEAAVEEKKEQQLAQRLAPYTHLF